MIKQWINSIVLKLVLKRTSKMLSAFDKMMEEESEMLSDDELDKEMEEMRLAEKES